MSPLTNSASQPRPIELGQDIIADGNTDFVLRPTSDDIDAIDQDFRKEDELPMVATAVSPAVRRAMREYESENLKYWNEPISGKYQ